MKRSENNTTLVSVLSKQTLLDATSTFRWKPSRELWGVFGGLVFMAVMCFVCALGMLVQGTCDCGTNTDPHMAAVASSLFFGCYGLLAGAIAIVQLRWLLHAEIVMTEHRLAWRGFGHWRSVQWNEVRDYYTQFRPREHKARSYVVTPDGTLCLDSLEWNNDRLVPLRAIIQQRAANARCNQWQLYGTRSGDKWPRAFIYPVDALHHRRFNYVRLIFALLGMAWPAYWLLNLVWQPRTWSDISAMIAAAGWVGGAFFAATGLAFLLCVPAILLFALQALQCQRRDMFAHRQQRIVADTDTILYRDQTSRIHASWNEVTDYYSSRDRGFFYTPVRHTVVTANGTFEFSCTLSHRRTLQEIIRRYATKSNASEWKYRHDATSEVLGSESERWSGEAPGVGQHIFHYRTRGYRICAAIPYTFLLVPLILTACALTAPDILFPGADWPALAILSAICLIPALIAYRIYKAASIRIDDAGIHQHTGLGVRFIPWHEVRECSMPKGSTAKVIGELGTIWFWDCIADADDLKAEITRRTSEAAIRRVA